MSRKPLVYCVVLLVGSFSLESTGQESYLRTPNQPLRWGTTPAPSKPYPIRQVSGEGPVLVAQGSGSTMSSRSSTVRRTHSGTPSAAARDGAPVVAAGGGSQDSANESNGNMSSVLRRPREAVSDSPEPAVPVQPRASEADEAFAPQPVVARRLGRNGRTADTVEPAEQADPAVDPAGEPAPTENFVPSADPGVAPPAVGGPGFDRQPAAAETMALRYVGPAVDLEAVGPRAIRVGRAAAYTITARNTGKAAASNLVVRVQLPPWVEVPTMQTPHGEAERPEGATPDAGDGAILWKIPELAAGARADLALEVIPRENQVFEVALDCTFTPPTVASTIAVQQPQLEVALSGPKDARFGDAVTMIVTVSNPGSGDAENVSVNLLAGKNPAERIPVGIIPAGQQKQIEVQLAANQPGTSRIDVEAVADGDIKAQAAGEILVRRAELSLAVTGPERAFTGAPAAYQMKVSNTGNAPSEETMLVVTLPPGAKLEAGTEGSQPAAGGLAWRIGSLPPGIERVYEIQCELATAGENRVEARTTAATGLAVTQTVTTTVEALADLKLTVNEPKGARAVGEEVEYEVSVFNRGTKAAEDVQVVVQFSNGLDPSAADGQAAQLVDGQVVFEPLGRIGPNQKTVLKVRAKAEQAGAHRFRVQVTSDRSETQLVTEGTTRFYNTSATPKQDAEPAPTLGARPISPSAPVRR